MYLSRTNSLHLIVASLLSSGCGNTSEMEEKVEALMTELSSFSASMTVDDYVDTLMENAGFLCRISVTRAPCVRFIVQSPLEQLQGVAIVRTSTKNSKRL